MVILLYYKILRIILINIMEIKEDIFKKLINGISIFLKT